MIVATPGYHDSAISGAELHILSDCMGELEYPVIVLCLEDDLSIQQVLSSKNLQCFYQVYFR